MSIITMPTNLPVSAANWGQARFDMVEVSESTGSISTRVLGPPRWTLSMRSSEVLPLALAGRWEAMVYGLRGRVNYLAAYNPGRPRPAGTLAGAPSTLGSTAAGATSVTLSASGTLLVGDMLQIGTGLGSSQLVKVMADATASAGSITVSFEPPLRMAFASTTPVVWSYPVAYFKARSPNSGGAFLPGGEGGYSLDLLEAFD